jgi:hypothetical protein
VSPNVIIDWAMLEAVGTVGTALVGAIGLWLVVIQLKSVKRSINGTSSSQVYTYSIDLVRLMIEHPELRRYVYRGETPPKDGAEADRVAAFFGGFNDLMEFVYAQRRLDILPEQEFNETWKPYFASLLARSPGLRNYVLENPDFYSTEIRELAEGQESKNQ